MLPTLSKRAAIDAILSQLQALSVDTRTREELVSRIQLRGAVVHGDYDAVDPPAGAEGHRANHAKKNFKVMRRLADTVHLVLAFVFMPIAAACRRGQRLSLTRFRHDDRTSLISLHSPRQFLTQP